MVEALLGLLMLALMEVALGIDNVVFVGLIVGKLPPPQQKKVWRFWMVYSPLLRAALLVGLVQLLKLSVPLFWVRGRAFTPRDGLLLAGGLFLLYKAVKEIHERVEGARSSESPPRKHSLRALIAQVALIDLVFSADSVLTAIGMTRTLWVMLSAIAIAMVLMIALAQGIQRLIERHPTLKMLALAFLLLIGFTLVGEGAGLHIPKGYIYFAMLFSLGVEGLNIWAGLRSVEKKSS